MSEKVKSEDYNNEPVYWCSECLSLNIANVDDDVCFCNDCGAGSIEKGDIRQWDEKYRDKYGMAFLEKKRKKVFKF